jgi:hypothetical protein
MTTNQNVRKTAAAAPDSASTRRRRFSLGVRLVG